MLLYLFPEIWVASGAAKPAAIGIGIGIGAEDDDATVPASHRPTLLRARLHAAREGGAGNFWQHDYQSF